MLNAVKKVLSDESGASTIEYGLITLTVVGAVTGVGAILRPQLTGLFTDVGTGLTAAKTAAQGD